MDKETNVKGGHSYVLAFTSEKTAKEYIEKLKKEDETYNRFDVEYYIHECELKE